MCGPFCQVCSGIFRLHISGQVAIVGSSHVSLGQFGICQISLSRISSDLFVWGWAGSCQVCLDRVNPTVSALVWSCETGLIGYDQVALVVSGLGSRGTAFLVLSFRPDKTNLTCSPDRTRSEAKSLSSETWIKFILPWQGYRNSFYLTCPEHWYFS
jgi:hypothetical protein